MYYNAYDAWEFQNVELGVEVGGGEDIEFARYKIELPYREE